MVQESIPPDGPVDPDASAEPRAGADNVPGESDRVTRVIGLGGSAGGIQALKHFFEAMPASSGMAFVVILHLAPDVHSALSEVLQRVTAMTVEQASDGQKVLPDHVYVIPPGKHLSLTDGHLRLSELPREHGKRLTVDLFFRSLADTHGTQAVAIVLSGADGDGALGIKRIKERGGLTIAQDPDEAEHPSMPRTAIATQMVDWVLRVGAMPARLLNYDAVERRLHLPSEAGPNPALAPRPTPSLEEAALRDVLSFLRMRTGRDFSYYKRATIVRRLARRMQVNETDDVPAYLSFLQTHPGEAGALLQDLLISVTNFFRDREAFTALEAHIPDLFRGKSHSDTVRVWVPACATGEEAYSIAMLLSEYAGTLDSPPKLQVFATDLDEDVIVEGRNGFYHSSIGNDVSLDRLQRFFVKEHNGYRVRRELREIILFAVHDLLKDSPFSRLDLISCRNLLIYLSREAQQRAFDIFHFALRPEGRLFLGTSESTDDASKLFAPVDKKHHVYSSRIIARTALPVPFGPSTLAHAIALREAADVPPVWTHAPPLAGPLLEFAAVRQPQRDLASLSALHLELLEQFGPPSLLINGDYDILHLSEGAARFLKFEGGEPSSNLFRTVHPMLRAELRAALFRAAESNRPSAALAVPFQLDQRQRSVDIRVSPASRLAADVFLVIFELRPDALTGSEGLAAQLVSEPAAQHLERELAQSKQHWREVVQQQEASAEELKANNEELQSMNEELRSATEELETSREELQSINEELTTVNHELKSKIDELGQINSDLHNLMGATEIATIFLDRELRIMRFTPPAVELFSLIATDVGRPLAHLSHSLGYPELLHDAAKVLQELVPIKRQVAEAGGRHFLARLLPYRTPEDRIAGVVLTFVDVTELENAQEAIRSAKRELEARVQERTAQLDAANAALRIEITEHQQAQIARQELQGRLVNAQEEERNRISRELHDEVGQQITALMLAMKSLESGPFGPQIPSKLRALRATAEQVGKNIHQLASELRPLALDELGLSRALGGYLDSWAERNSISIDFLAAGIDEPRLPKALEMTLYRIVQEATNNVSKHAAAKNVSVSVECRGRTALAIVEDDGRGFDAESSTNPASPHLGISGMRERASIMGGTLTIESSPSGGTTVRVQLPILVS